MQLGTALDSNPLIRWMQGVGAYYWVSAYFVLLCFQMTYGKMITNAMKYSISSTVLYNNALSIPPMLLFAV